MPRRCVLCGRERIKIDLNDECDCGGVFYGDDSSPDWAVTVRLPPSLQAAAPVVLTRREFEEISVDLFEKAITPVRQVLDRVEMRRSDVDEVVLVGGSTRMAHVRKMLRDFFDQEPNCDVSPEEAVAHGTAIQAAILTDRKKIAVGATEAALHQHIDVER